MVERSDPTILLPNVEEPFGAAAKGAKPGESERRFDVGHDVSRSLVSGFVGDASTRIRNRRPTHQEDSTGVIELDASRRQTTLGWLGTRVVPILALAGVCAWAWSEISSITDGPERVRPVGEILQPKIFGHSVDLGSQTEIDEWDGRKGGLGKKILSSQVEWLDLDDKSVDRVTLNELLPRQKISIVNLWATWCEACTEEFAHFTTVLNGGRAESAWGSEVQFLTMLVGDPDVTIGDAHTDWASKLPEGTAFVAARQFNELTSQLQEQGLLPKPLALPVTFVLDCRRQIKWIHLKALDDTSTLELRETISELRSELNTSKCRTKSRAKKVKPKPEKTPVGEPGDAQPEAKKVVKDRCGDGRCDASNGEDLRTCPRDCLRILPDDE